MGEDRSHHGGRRIVFLGPPNSGKGTQAALLAQALGVPAISTGEMLRQAVAEGNELGEQVRGLMERGELVCDQLMGDLVRARLRQPDASGGFILDGYPRTEAQAHHLERILVGEGEEIDGAVLIDAPEEVLVGRALERGREDDLEEVIRERLRQYRVKTAPLIERYRRSGRLASIDGDQPIERVTREILRALGVAVQVGTGTG